MSSGPLWQRLQTSRCIAWNSHSTSELKITGRFPRLTPVQLWLVFTQGQAPAPQERGNEGAGWWSGVGAEFTVSVLFPVRPQSSGSRRQWPLPWCSTVNTAAIPTPSQTGSRAPPSFPASLAGTFVEVEAAETRWDLLTSQGQAWVVCLRSRKTPLRPVWGMSACVCVLGACACARVWCVLVTSPHLPESFCSCTQNPSLPLGHLPVTWRPFLQTNVMAGEGRGPFLQGCAHLGGGRLVHPTSSKSCQVCDSMPLCLSHFLFGLPLPSQPGSIWPVSSWPTLVPASLPLGCCLLGQKPGAELTVLCLVKPRGESLSLVSSVKTLTVTSYPLLPSPHVHESLLCLFLHCCPVNKFFRTTFLDFVYVP